MSLVTSTPTNQTGCNPLAELTVEAVKFYLIFLMLRKGWSSSTFCQMPVILLVSK